jgi:hypothetical protein
MFMTALKAGYTVQDVYDLRKQTNIGDYIRFRRKTSYQSNEITIRGFVVKKYPHIFMLSNGETYSWKDYLLGRQM